MQMLFSTNSVRNGSRKGDASTIIYSRQVETRVFVPTPSTKNDVVQPTNSHLRYGMLDGFRDTSNCKSCDK